MDGLTAMFPGERIELVTLWQARERRASYLDRLIQAVDNDTDQARHLCALISAYTRGLEDYRAQAAFAKALEEGAKAYQARNGGSL